MMLTRKHKLTHEQGGCGVSYYKITYILILLKLGFRKGGISVLILRIAELGSCVTKDHMVFGTPPVLLNQLLSHLPVRCNTTWQRPLAR